MNVTNCQLKQVLTQMMGEIPTGPSVDILAGNGISVDENPAGTFTITNTGETDPLNIIAGENVSVLKDGNDVTISAIANVVEAYGAMNLVPLASKNAQFPDAPVMKELILVDAQGGTTGNLLVINPWKLVLANNVNPQFADADGNPVTNSRFDFYLPYNTPLFLGEYNMTDMVIDTPQRIDVPINLYVDQGNPPDTNEGIPTWLNCSTILTLHLTPGGINPNGSILLTLQTVVADATAGFYFMQDYNWYMPGTTIAL